MRTSTHDVRRWSALLAASIGVVLYKRAEPLLDRWAREERADGEG
jgi:hypothetical protein